MSNSVNFKNADQVIEQFGGIRPFASKLGVPVTTVQGWKKRNSIPENRWDEILKLANELNLSITDSNDNRPIAAAPAATVTPMSAPARPVATETPRVTKAEKAGYSRGYSAAQGILVTGISVGLSVAILAVLFGPDFIVSNPSQRITALEQKVGTTGPATTGNSGLLTTLQQGQTALQDTINNTIMPKINELQATVGALGDPQTMAQLSAQIKAMEQSQQGQATLDAAVTELKTIVAGLQGQVDGLDVALAAAQKENGALAETLGKVSTTDLTAAAMLLALNQFRTSIDRQEPLGDDIALLKSVINPDENPDLAASIDRLTPFATSGVMSPGGLENELSVLANDIVEARLKGDQAPVTDIVRARLQNIFDVRNNGVPVIGTMEQKLIAQAQQQLAAGDVAAAKATLETLPAPSREVAQPVITKAEQTLTAQQVESQVTRFFARSLEGLRGAPAGTPVPMGTNRSMSSIVDELATPPSPPSTGIAPITPTEQAEILQTAPMTPPAAAASAMPAPTKPATPPAAAVPTPAVPATPAPAQPTAPQGAKPAPEAPSL